MNTKRLFPYYLLAPLILIQLFIIIGPSITNIGYSLTKWDGLSNPTFVGLANFAKLFTDRVFYISLIHNIQWTLFFLTVPIFLALTVAVLASRIKRGQMVFRTLFFLPYVVASVVNAEMWRHIFSPVRGIGIWLAQNLGWEWANISFFGNRDVVLLSIATVDNWQWWGFLMAVYLAAMQTIPTDLFDAAKVDGANSLQEFIHVIIPGIRPTLVYTLIMTMAASFVTFEYVWILTQGGPAGGSEVLGSYMYKTAFIKYNVGYASAIGLWMAIIAIGFSFIFGLLRRLGWEV